MKTSLAQKKLHLLRSLALSTFFLLPFAMLAQNPRGSLRGTVQDTSGGRISSAKIVVLALESALRRETTANDRGDFSIDDLVPGNYRLTVTASGFADASSEVQVNIS